MDTPYQKDPWRSGKGEVTLGADGFRQETAFELERVPWVEKGEALSQKPAAPFFSYCLISFISPSSPGLWIDSL